MTRKAQKEDEGYILETLLKQLNMSDEVEISEGGEPPDFLIHHKGETIAVEITEYYSEKQESGGSQKRAFETAWKKVRDEVFGLRDNQPKLDKLSVFLKFKQWDIQGLKRSEFIKAVVSFICEHDAQVSRDQQCFPISHSNGILSPWLSKICLKRVNYFGEWNCNLLSADCIGYDQLPDIADQKLKTTRPDNIDEFWLVIAGNEARLSQFLSIPDLENLKQCPDLNDVLTKGPFDKVFIISLRATYQWRKKRLAENDAWEIVA